MENMPSIPVWELAADVDYLGQYPVEFSVGKCLSCVLHIAKGGELYSD